MAGLSTEALAQAQSQVEATCGAVLTSDAYLTEDLNCTGPGLTLDGDLTLDLRDVEPMTQPYPLVNVLREDVVVVGLDRDEVLAMAPEAEDGRFRVPPVIGLDL